MEKLRSLQKHLELQDLLLPPLLLHPLRPLLRLRRGGAPDLAGELEGGAVVGGPERGGGGGAAARREAAARYFLLRRRSLSASWARLRSARRRRGRIRSKKGAVSWWWWCARVGVPRSVTNSKNPSRIAISSASVHSFSAARRLPRLGLGPALVASAAAAPEEEDAIGERSGSD
uniref:Uncharacterized protein n=1 Tax=Ananas comosus var. bracteatus TaxID=296719 RepID=A0A6V7NE41_ANACO|nr:unnamed protein product [Ananas comosus var. bracteatus]